MGKPGENGRWPQPINTRPPNEVYFTPLPGDATAIRPQPARMQGRGVSLVIPRGRTHRTIVCRVGGRTLAHAAYLSSVTGDSLVCYCPTGPWRRLHPFADQDVPLCIATQQRLLSGEV